MIGPLDGRTVLVTGGTGSFGQAFVRYALTKHNPRKVIVYSRDELKQSEMDREIRDDRLRLFIGDVRDTERLTLACRGVDVIVHAAALKRIEVAEYDPEEAIKTNVFGALNVIKAALAQKVRRVVALSSDKAAAPVTLYGATKLCAEKGFTAANSYTGDRPTRFSCVRYGNVIDSRGSVIPQWRGAKVIHITDPQMTRFWLRMEDAIALVMFALENMTGGEVFVPKAPSSSIEELAQAINPTAERLPIGPRSGEKKHETLIVADEARYTVEHENGYVIQSSRRYWGGPEFIGQQAPQEDCYGGRWEYRSDTNPWRMGVEELREWVG
jgi:UDP-N-acetylglucosamine 4,6-dehydratase